MPKTAKECKMKMNKNTIKLKKDKRKTLTLNTTRHAKGIIF